MNATEVKTKDGVEVLLDRAMQIEREKVIAAIEALLTEAEDLTLSTATRQAEIKTQLKALGYTVKRPRKTKG